VAKPQLAQGVSKPGEKGQTANQLSQVQAFVRGQAGPGRAAEVKGMS